MEEIILDVETKKAFATGNNDPASLGVSYVGICKREISNPVLQKDSGPFGDTQGKQALRLNSGQARMTLNKKDEFVGFFEDELSKLWPILEQARRIVGFNIIGFDYPALSPYYHGDFSSLPTLDILDEVKNSIGHRVSLNAIARETLGVQKSGTGLDAIEFFEKGKLDELAKYCLMDVKITRDVYDYGLREGYLKFINKWNRLITAKIDFSYKDEEETKVQMSLGV